MQRTLRLAVALFAAAATQYALAQRVEVVDLPTRAGVTQRFVLSAPAEPRAVVVLFAGGHGGLQIDKSGRMAWGSGNFLVRSVPLFNAEGLATALVDAPSDRQQPPYLSGFRQTDEHATDVRAVMQWLKAQLRVPVWLVGTSRGTQSAASVALQSAGEADGLVLTATILTDTRSRPVPGMAVDALKVPVLVVHHEQDGCRYCLFSDTPRLMSRLASVPRHELIAFTGGSNVGDPCEARAYHGFNGIEPEVVRRVAAWIAPR